jgi:hypothetical protein
MLTFVDESESLVIFGGMDD